MREHRLIWLVAGVASAALAFGFVACGSDDEDPLEELNQLEQYWKQRHGKPGLGKASFELLAKARPDECFDRIGGDYRCAPGERPNKVNQAYVWGLTGTPKHVWFGTVPNMICWGMGGPTNPIGPHRSEAWACEYDQSRFIQDFNLQVPAAQKIPPQMGDWRPPQIFRTDPATGVTTEMTWQISAPADLARLHHTFGLRSAGALGDLVFLAGPVTLLGPGATYGASGVNVFVFKDDGTFLGSQSFPQYNDIRRWLVVGDQLYAGVGNTAGGGSVLRFAGLQPKTATEDFALELEVVVDDLDGGAADLAEHEGRIFVSTWPNMTTVGLPAPFGLWMSPKLATGGLLEEGDWAKVWAITAYEPDLVTAATYAGGAMASFDGDLYFGTMHMPFVGALAHFQAYGMPGSGEELKLLATVLGSHRPTALFRGRGFGKPGQKVEVLYGERILPVQNPLTGKWELRENNLPDPEPRFGHSGYNNFFNTYTWSMAVNDGRLYVGTFDWSFPALEQVKLFAGMLLGRPLLRTPDLPVSLGFGADLLAFDSARSGGRVLSLDGVGNYTNYGVRNMLSNGGELYLGTANPMNLMTDPDDGKPEGGWELRRLE